jgi:DNA-binding LacI/PurR family transcriptional regulator
MTSLKDVAKLASVSLMTVSRAINTPDKLNKQTYQRVMQAIEQLNYVPNLSARKIRGTGSGPRSIGVLALETAMTPYSVELLQSIEKTASQYQWNTFIVNLFDDNQADRAIDTLLSYRPDGIIYTAMGMRQVNIPAKLLHKPIVLANCITESNTLPCYIPDDYQGQYQAMQYVIEKGYQRPLCLYLSDNTLAGKIRRQALERAWQDMGNDLSQLLSYHLPQIVPHTEQEYRQVLPIIQQHIHDKPDFDVVICGNDRIALLVYQYLLSIGLHIPNDVGVLGYDNMVGIGDLFYPPLTTVQLAHYEIGQQAALHIIENRPQTDTVYVACPFLNRQSL